MLDLVANYFAFFLLSSYQIAVILFVLKEFGWILPKKQLISEQSSTALNAQQQAENPLTAVFNNLGPMMEKMMSNSNVNQTSKSNNNNVEIASTD